jgi:hypothetical protein
MNRAGGHDVLRNLKTHREGATPENGDYGKAVAELDSSKMVGAGTVFECGRHLPVTHMAFFKPAAIPFWSELRSKDRWSAKEWKYFSAAGVWLELSQTALAGDGDADDEFD